MNTEAILSTLLSAAAFLKHALQEVAGQSLKDAYAAAKTYLERKLAPKPDAACALEMAVAKPESLLRKAVLAEATADCDLDNDRELIQLMSALAEALPRPLSVGSEIHVSGRGHHVQVAGRDLVTTTKHITRNAITPDARHVTPDERAQLKAILGEVAMRLAGADGRANFAGAHRLLQRRFSVASYLLLPREQFAAALAFLKQQRAMNRSRLRHRNSSAYRQDFFRAVFAGARELGWNAEQVHAFAVETLGLKHPITSLKELGPQQLKALAEAVQRRAAKARAAKPS